MIIFDDPKVLILRHEYSKEDFMIDNIVIDENDYENIEDLFYRFITVDSIDFEVECIKKNLKLVKELFIEEIHNSPFEERLFVSRMEKMLHSQLFSKFCHFAETLALIALAYLNPQSTLEPYSTKKDQMKSLVKNLKELDVSAARDFYRDIQGRKEDVIAEVMAYPTLVLQSDGNREILTKSCKNIKNILSPIGEMYIEFVQFYNSYKHGYRIVPCDVKGKDAFLFFDRSENPKIKTYEKEDIDKIFSLVTDCRIILNCIVENNNTRMKVGDLEKEVDVRLTMFLEKNDEVGKKYTPDLRYKKRKNGVQSYLGEKQIMSPNDKKHCNNKWILFDLTEKKILLVSNKYTDLTLEYYNRNLSNEFSFVYANDEFLNDIREE